MGGKGEGEGEGGDYKSTTIETAIFSTHTSC